MSYIVWQDCGLRHLWPNFVLDVLFAGRGGTPKIGEKEVSIDATVELQL